MIIVHPFRPLSLCALSISLASCAVFAPTPPPVARMSTPRSAASPDWFHHELVLARHARATHQPANDAAGAQRAYSAIMLPACAHVEKLGPDKYRARCKILIAHASAPAARPQGMLPCDDHDDSNDTEAQITACSD